MKKNKNYTVSSGNIFEDLGIANPEERLAKAKLAYQINTLIQEKKLTQNRAAKLLGIDQPKISLLSKGKLSGFSLERLFRFLNILGQEITIRINSKKQSDSNNDNQIITLTSLNKATPIKKSKLHRNPYAAYARKKK